MCVTTISRSRILERQNGGYLRTGRRPAQVTERAPIPGSPVYRIARLCRADHCPLWFRLRCADPLIMSAPVGRPLGLVLLIAAEQRGPGTEALWLPGRLGART
jgi:hypothetical protein